MLGLEKERGNCGWLRLVKSGSFLSASRSLTWLLLPFQEDEEVEVEEEGGVAELFFNNIFGPSDSLLPLVLRKEVIRILLIMAIT